MYIVALQAVGDVLILYGGRQYSKGAFVPFESSFPLTDIALAGIPGTAGFLLVETKGQIRDSSRLLLTIPFRLRPCHLGFEPTKRMKNPSEVRESYSKHG